MKTRTYVINLNSIISFICIFVLIISLFFVFINEGIYKYIISSSYNYTQKTDSVISAFPILNTKNEKIKGNTMLKVLSIIFNENLSNPYKILSNKIPFISSIKDELSTDYNFVNESNYYYMPKIIEKIISDNNSNITYNPATETTIKSVKENGNFLEQKGITVNNKSGYNLKLEELYKEKLKLTKVVGKPQILIVHTHATESYNPTDRSQDANMNVIRIGKEMAEIFKENNIEVIHSQKFHDIPKFNNSYNNTLNTINEILTKNPTINIVLDIHRDAMITNEGETYKVVNSISDKKASQVMLVVGTNKGGLTHDNWRENLKFAIKCQEEINKISKNLARPIDLREERFNQHATYGSLIIEVGTNGNTLEESINSAKLTAEAISKVINNL